MNDLHVSISYLTGDRIARIGKELRSDPSDTQPGFYLRASKNEGYEDIVKYTRLPLPVVEALSRAIDATFLDLAPELRRVIGGRVGGSMRVALDKHRAETVRRREAAEAALRRAQATLAALDAEELALVGEPVCQCWNEGQYGRVHREDCPLHKDTPASVTNGTDNAV